jgi:hypothetical protein
LIIKILKIKNILGSFKIKEANDRVDIIGLVIKDQFMGNKIKSIITDENIEFINGSEAIKILRNLENRKKIKNIKIASISAFEDEVNKNIINRTFTFFNDSINFL